ncbi:hypothetical protein GGR26_001121 [Lewinella marina]|uniref:Uncharacterized protein n=1 Tax=Neolewinella marina TaxID=438751 RepID=A0A2G0CHW4_9BACT|nr:hypothetical protein [Neolewinella marina]NJB85376.1 hypothetical protein [Neolewinella marina]PHK99510.1 hypothetical protein CGL56_00175 [Neolewinella marina]
MGWHLNEDAVFGLHRGYPVMIRQRLLLGQPRLETIRIKTDPISGARRQALQLALESLDLPGAFVRTRVTSSALHLRYRPLYSWRRTPLTLTAVEAVIAVADTFGLQPTRTVASSPEALRRCFYTGEADTLLGETDVFEFENHYYSLRGRRVAFARPYVYGLVGGSLYALVGVVPTIAAASLMDPVPGVVGLGIAFLCYYGYRQFNGLAGPRTKLTLLSLSLLWALITAAGCAIVQRLSAGREWADVYRSMTEWSGGCAYECAIAAGTGLVASLLLSEWYLTSARRFRKALTL